MNLITDKFGIAPDLYVSLVGSLIYGRLEYSRLASSINWISVLAFMFEMNIL